MMLVLCAPLPCLMNSFHPRPSVTALRIHQNASFHLILHGWRVGTRLDGTAIMIDLVGEVTGLGT